MNPPLTTESLAALRQSSEILAAVCDRAAKCDHLEARNKHLQEHNDGIAARHGVLQAVIRKAREGLGNVLPECREMSLPELVTEAARRIQNLREAAAPKPAPTSGDAVSIALRIARHLLNDLERVELGQQMIHHLRIGENVDTGALRILADRVEWLEGEAEQCRVMLHDVAAGRVDSRVRQERDALSAAVVRIQSTLDAYKASGRMLEENVQRLTAERDPLSDEAMLDDVLAENARLQSELDATSQSRAVFMMELDALRLAIREARAENGRQAATIAAMLPAEVKPTSFSFVTTNTGRAFGCHFQAWMASRIDPASPHP